ncbi:unnamed protein product [Allacma fusca]|uniref:Uncharacterized protein n=1 Tax=Allacma fusca TaxID=39272 RepID=A0A8J2KVZ3_9HEXA|nr:unnamed protein product [Allacma fusca]
MESSELSFDLTTIEENSDEIDQSISDFRGENFALQSYAQLELNILENLTQVVHRSSSNESVDLHSEINGLKTKCAELAGELDLAQKEVADQRQMMLLQQSYIKDLEDEVNKLKEIKKN